jgi:hypothetical protein
MARRPLPALAGDFADVVSLLKERHFIPDNPPAKMIANAKSIHSSTYGLMLWRFRLSRTPEHGRVFLEEIASDALQLLPQVMLGYTKTASLLARGVLENAFRHIYFHDHPIEFQRMNREKWFLSMEQLLDYSKNHPVYLTTETRFDALSQAKSLYSELSASVHGSSVRHLEMHTALKKIAYSDAAAGKQAEQIRRVSQITSFMLATFHAERMRRFDLADRRLILRSMPAIARQIWTELGS